MTEASFPAAVPEEIRLDAQKENLAARAKRLAGRVGTGSLHLAGVESAKEEKEKLATMGALGAVGIVGTLAAYHALKYWPHELDLIKESGRHPIVGYMSASAASRYRRFNNWIGMLVAGLLGDAAAEVGQEIVHNGISGVPEIIEPGNRGGNEQDLVFALAGAELLHARQTAGRLVGKFKGLVWG